MKGKKLASVLLTMGMVAAVASTCALASCKKKESPPYTGPKQTEFANKTPASQAKVVYVGTASGNQDGSSPENAYGFYDFFMRKVAMEDVNTLLLPGTIVKVTPGKHKVDYPVRIERSGNYNDYLIFEAADPTKETVLDFSNMTFSSTNRGVEIYGNYCYWRNVDICGAGDNGLYIGGNYNIVENCKFYNNRDTGLQLGRSYSNYTTIDQWPSYNLIKNCTSFNNYDNETYGENADGFAAKLTVGYGNIFDGCIAYRNSDDGWDLYGKSDTGMIGRVILYNCVAFENGFIQTTQKEFNAMFPNFYEPLSEANTISYMTRDGDGNGFKLGGSTLPGDVYVENCMSFNNRMHGLTDNSNPGKIEVHNYTAFNNGAIIDNVSYNDIHDVNGNTQFYQADTSSSEDKGEATDYYNVDQDGYIVDSNNNRIILDDEGIRRKDLYVALDEEGYICANSKDGAQRQYFYYSEDTEMTTKIKGHFIKFNAEASTLNENFGKLKSEDKVSDITDKCNNLDIARSEASYNAFTGVLSTVTGNGNQFTGADQFRASAANSVVLDLKPIEGSSSYDWGRSDITTTMDADTINHKSGTASTFVPASDIFTTLPANDMGIGAASYNIHSTYRNEDGSINMGNLLKVKDYSKLLGENNKVGCDLTKTSWADYPHYDYTYMTDSNYVRNGEEAIVRAVESLLYIQTDANATYQNFQVPTSMLGCKITWATSNVDILAVGDSEELSISRHTVAEVDVNRAAEDTIVTLTATITSPQSVYTLTKKFDINVKAITYEIGEVIIEGLVGKNVIMSQYAAGGAPNITIRNAMNYSGKLIPEDRYTINTEYEFSTESKNGPFTPKLKFGTKDEGIYKATTTITLGDQVKTIEYMIFVVSDNSVLKFMETGGTPEYSLAMRHDGFNISGTLTNVSGSMHVLAVDAGAGAPSKDTVKSNGEKVAITWDEISFDFKHDNSKAYDVYFVTCNPKGDVTSDLYKVEVKIDLISDETAFMNLATSGGKSSVVYQLSKDLDYSDKVWKAVKSSDSVAFKGLFDGRGHTIKNVSITGSGTGKGNASIFPMIAGGAIINVNFDNIVIEGDQEIGIIAQARGGYIYNVNMHNISVTGNQRISALVGHVGEQLNSPLIIDRVTLINDTADYTIACPKQKAGRAGGLIGFVQTSDSVVDATVDIRISNCYVDAFIGSEDSGENGGIVATYDTEYMSAFVDFSLDIRNCYFAGTVKANSRCGGIVGYHKGLELLSVYGCVNVGSLYHAGSTEPLASPQKNCSGIMGGYSAGTVYISWCFSNIAEHNANYDVTVIENDTLATQSVWSSSMEFDMENVWEFVKDSNDSLVAPYVRLRTITF